MSWIYIPISLLLPGPHRTKQVYKIIGVDKFLLLQQNSYMYIPEQQL